MTRKKMSGAAVEEILTHLGVEVAAKTKEVLAKGGQTILDDARSKINTISGELANSGHLEINKKGNVVKVVFDAKDAKTDYSYSKIVEFRPGHDRPFLYPAYDAHRDSVKQNIIDTIREAVRANAVY